MAIFFYLPVLFSFLLHDLLIQTGEKRGSHLYFELFLCKNTDC